jgi:halocyanin-like protein
MDFSDTNSAVTRRGVLRAGAGTAAGLASASVVGSAAAQSDAYGGYLSDEGTWGGVTVDATGRDLVVIDVGAEGNGGSNAFAPPAVAIEPGTTVRWVWTGNGVHNVIAEDESFSSGTAVGEAGTTFEQTFDETGVTQYFCRPHKTLGMKGVVVVGEENIETETRPPVTDAEIDFGGYLSDANAFEGVEDFRGRDEVTVKVGAGEINLAFSPAAIHIDPGTTVIWEWTGEGGGHNVVAENDAFRSGEPVAAEGTTFEHTFEAQDNASDNLHRYFCDPHKAAGMKGGIAVGDNIGSGGGDDLEMTAIWGGAGVFGTVALLGVAAYHELVNDDGDYE